MLPHSHNPNADQDEESRVVFVGATRGRSQLLIGRAYRQYASRLKPSGRAYSLKTNENKPRAQIEIGRNTDIDVQGLAGRGCFADAAAVRTSQSRICAIADQSVSLVAESDRAGGFAYRLREDGRGPSLALLSKAVNADLFSVARVVQSKVSGPERRPPDSLRHLHVHGVRTVVLPPDAPAGETLHDPWRSSGIMLAPLILGYTTVYFPRKRRPRRRWRA